MKIQTTLDNLSVLYEDNHLLVVNKRSGDLVQGDRTGDEPLVEIAKRYIARKYNKQGAVFLGVVHRLDRPTSGALVFARTSKALTRLNEQFAGTQVQKTYWAWVQGKLPKAYDTLSHHLVRNPKQNKSYAHPREVTGSKKAQLAYRVLKTGDRYTLIEIQLLSGRHHQIRAQLAAIGCVIKGDLKYGSARSNRDGSIHLHARRLVFVHPVTKVLIDCMGELPEDPLWTLCREGRMD